MTERAWGRREEEEFLREKEERLRQEEERLRRKEERLRQEERLERFGRVVLRTRQGGWFTLELFSEAEKAEVYSFYSLGAAQWGSIMCKGYYVSIGSTGQQLAVGVDVIADPDVLKAIYDQLAHGDFRGVGDPWRGGTFEGDFHPRIMIERHKYVTPPEPTSVPDFYASVSGPFAFPDSRMWKGVLSSYDPRDPEAEVFDFLLEQYGTIEPVSLLLGFLFFSLCARPLWGDYISAAGLAERCHEAALRTCGGEGNIKSLSVTNGITGMTLRLDRHCQYECFEERRGVDTPANTD